MTDDGSANGVLLAGQVASSLIVCLPLVSVLVIAGFELKSGEAATMRGHSRSGFCVPTAQQAIVLPTERTYQTLLFHRLLRHQFLSARALGHLICTLRGS